jgi:hypothetical protein
VLGLERNKKVERRKPPPPPAGLHAERDSWRFAD